MATATKGSTKAKRITGGAKPGMISRPKAKTSKAKGKTAGGAKPTP
jgi:hypothetical protein